MNHVHYNHNMSNAFLEFFGKLKYVDWDKPQDITSSFKSADLITCKKGLHNRIIFNIGHNKFRMICGYYFGKNEVILFIKFAGTHEEYDAVDVCSINMFK